MAKIRAADGLLQHWLELNGSDIDAWGKGYWSADGYENKEAFKQLSKYLDKGQLRGEQSGEFGSPFSQSFPNRANKIWSKLNEPFLKPNKKDLADIDDRSVDEGIKPRPVLEDEQKSDPEEHMIKHLREKRIKQEAERSPESESSKDDSSHEAEDDSAEESSEGGSEDWSISGEEDDSSQGEDQEGKEWLEAKKIRPTAAMLRGRKGSLDSEDDSLFNESGTMEHVTSNIISPCPKNRILDSDDEGHF